jgi:hypothetical protein
MDMVAVEQLDGGSYKVVVERVIGIGARFNISPSYGYAGVEDGEVLVTDIVTAKEYAASPHRFPEIEGYLSAAYSKDTIDLSGDSIPTEYRDTVWITFTYNRSNTDHDKYVFPIDEFAIYTSDVN